MKAFHFENRTEVWFGKDCVSQNLLLKQYGDSVMLAYGGGSIKRNGIYDEVMGILDAAGSVWWNFPASCRTPLMPRRRRAQSWHERTILT